MPRRSGAVVLGLGLLAGCPDATAPSTDGTSDAGAAKPTTTPSAMRQEAHRKAFAELLGLAERALLAADPIAAADIGHGELSPTPVTAGRLQTIRDPADAAWTTAADIDERMLDVRQRAVLRTIRFALARIRDATHRRAPWRADPEWIVVETTRLLDAIDSAAAGGACERCASALSALADELEPAGTELAAASLPVLTAAEHDLGAMIERVDRLGRDPALGEASRAAAAALRELRERYAAVGRHLPKAARQGFDGPFGPALPTPEEVVRLPERLEADVLRRRLEVEENLAVPVDRLFAEVGQTIERLKLMRDRTEASGAESPSVVDVPRCDRVWAPIARWAAKQPGLADTTTLDCHAVASRLGGARVTDAALGVLLVKRGVVEPSRRARRRAQAPVVAAVEGRVAPPSHRHAMTIAVLTQVARADAEPPSWANAAVRSSIDAALRDLCDTAAALWIHGGLGDDATLEDRLRPFCPSPVDETIGRAQARPRQALQALGLVRVGTGPADIAALEGFWWSPLGLVEVLADPLTLSVPDVPRSVQLEHVRDSSDEDAP